MKIDNEIKNCTLCGDLPKLYCDSIKMGNTKFIILGESPAKNGWIESKKAFYNTSGKLQATGRVLEKLLNTIDLSVEDIYFTECCKCIIEDRNKLEKCSINCFPILTKQLESLPCKILVPMGMYPTQIILGVKISKFGDYVGKQFNITINNKHYIVMPIYHTSPLNPKGYVGNLEAFEKLKSLNLH